MNDTKEFLRLNICDIEKNENIYSYLRRKGYSYNYINKLRKSLGYIILNGENCFLTERISNGDILDICKNPDTKSCIQNCIIPLDIVFEDNDLLIVNKPSNLATMPTKSHYDYNLAGAVVNYMNEKTDNFTCRIINRLDKDTSGLVIIAKNSLVCNFLTQKNAVSKTYYAICQGNLKKPISVNKKIFTDTDENGQIIIKRIVSEEVGKDAVTHIFPIQNYKNYFLAKITLEHGRTHQIRAHLASISHPLIGDTIYGTANKLIDHTALVCKQISIIHPISKEILTFEVDFPEEFKKLLRN